MKKKILLSLIVIFLILTLAGCGNKEKIEEVIDNYYLALSNRQYELAQTYCIEGGSKYKYAEKLRKEQGNNYLYPMIKTTFTPCITKWGWIKRGDTSCFPNTTVSTEMVITATDILGVTKTGWELGMSTTKTTPSVEFLDKVNGVWKLK